MKPPDYKSIYSERDFDVLGFHDCRLYGICWNRDSFSLTLDLDYILQWVEVGGRYNFWISPAELRFEDVADVQVSLNWARLTMECQIEDLHRLDSRKTPSGLTSDHWRFDLSEPEGSIELWATGFKLAIKAAPTLSMTTYLR